MKKSAILFSFSILSQFIITSCTDASSNDDLNEPVDTKAILYKEVLTNVSREVITATYQRLFNNATSLKTAAQNLSLDDEASLTAVKEAWMATRSPWEKSEGFLYGPVDTEGIDPAIDSWPVNLNDINAILNSTQAITPSLLESNNEARGFHTIEYFVWGLNNTKTAAEFTLRELEYLVAATENLESKTEQLYTGWANTGNDFARNFTHAGESASIYSSQKAALSELVDGIITIADEVGNGKIETPLNGNGGAAMPEAEESRFSNNSKLDFADNIRSIQNIYSGDFEGIDGKGLTDIVILYDATLDTEINTAISEAIDAIIEIPETFTIAITTNRTAVENAQTKVSELQKLLQTKLQPLITNL